MLKNINVGKNGDLRIKPQISGNRFNCTQPLFYRQREIGSYGDLRVSLSGIIYGSVYNSKINSYKKYSALTCKKIPLARKDLVDVGVTSNL